MQVATSSVHFDAMAAHWNADDQDLLDTLLMTEPAEVLPQPQDAQMFTASSPPSLLQTEKQTAGKHSKLSAIERRVKHREVVKRAYHRNKAALKSLCDTVKELEGRLQKLSLSKKQETATCVSKSQATYHIQRRYALLTTEQEELDNEAARLRLLLNYRHQFATNMVALAQRAASISSDDSDNSDTDSDTATTSSAASVGTVSPSSCMPFDVNTPLAMLASGCNVLPQSTLQVAKTPFYSEPSPTLVGLTVTSKTPLAVSMQKQLGYKPLSSSDATALVNEIYRSILSFSLSGEAISTGASIMGWEDKRLLEGTSVKFSLRKQYPGENALQLMTSTWQCFSDPECTETKFHGLMTLRILQRVNDDTIVALRESESEDGSKLYRCVYLLFRLRTRKGFLICVQSVAPEHLADPLLSCVSRDGKLVQWTELSGWFVFEPTGDGEIYGPFYQEGAQVEYGGCMDYGDHESVATLAMNTLSIVFKWESMMVGPIFTLPSSS